MCGVNARWRAKAGLALLLAATVPAVALVARAAGGDMSAAPADQYFGPLKMSALGIRMRVDDLGRRYHARTISDQDLVHDGMLAESAYFAWAKEYPNDPWLAPTAFHLEQLYQTVQSQAARDQATKLLHYIAQTFAKSRYGHLSRLRLAQGFPPLHAESVVVATPNPYTSSSAAPVNPSVPPSAAVPARASSPAAPVSSAAP